MKERLITGAGFWTAACLLLVAAFTALISLPYLGTSAARPAPAAAFAVPSPAPAAAHARPRRNTTDADLEREWRAAAAAMTAHTSSAIRTASNPARSSRASAPAPSDTADEPIDPIDLARAALASVGSDPDAEIVWLAIINDPTIDAEFRKDLIEDLNEDGFPDPDHPNAADLPLIEARLALIDRIAPDALDDTNAAALAEARKDLAEMRDKLKPAPATE
jgi:hypothetical protein